MKKLLAVFLVTLVVSSVFAVGTVKVGGAFGFDSGKTSLPGATDWEDVSYRQHGFGFSVAMDYNLGKKSELFVDYTLLFTNGLEVKREGETEYINLFDEAGTLLDNTEEKKLNYSVAAGIAYNLIDKGPFGFKVGGGVFFERLINKIKGTAGITEVEEIRNLYNIGVTFLSSAEYCFSDNLGLSVSLMPRLGLYNGITSTEIVDGVEDTDSISGFKTSFSIPVSVGILYKI